MAPVTFGIKITKFELKWTGEVRLLKHHRSCVLPCCKNLLIPDVQGESEQHSETLYEWQTFPLCRTWKETDKGDHILGTVHETIIALEHPPASARKKLLWCYEVNNVREKTACCHWWLPGGCQVVLAGQSRSTGFDFLSPSYLPHNIKCVPLMQIHFSEWFLFSRWTNYDGLFLCAKQTLIHTVGPQRRCGNNNSSLIGCLPAYINMPHYYHPPGWLVVAARWWGHS